MSDEKYTIPAERRTNLQTMLTDAGFPHDKAIMVLDLAEHAVSEALVRISQVCQSAPDVVVELQAAMLTAQLLEIQCQGAIFTIKEMMGDAMLQRSTPC